MSLDEYKIEKEIIRFTTSMCIRFRCLQVNEDLYDESKNPVYDAIRIIKRSFPELTVACDLCLCAFTANGHCCKFQSFILVSCELKLNTRRSSDKRRSTAAYANRVDQKRRPFSIHLVLKFFTCSVNVICKYIFFFHFNK